MPDSAVRKSHIEARCSPFCAGARIGLLAVLAAGAVPAQFSNSAARLTVVGGTAPAGGWTQIKVFIATPCQITTGALSMDFDPAIFGNISNVAVFSATGDAWGYAMVYGNHVDVHFTSLSGGIGQLPGLPVFVASMPVHAGLATGSATAVTVDLSASNLNGTNGSPYALTVVPGTLQVGGTLSVQSATPGGGLMPAGTVIRIAGTGFDVSTTAAVDGVGVRSLQLVGPQEIDVTLDTATELTGKHLRLANAAGEQIDYFPALPSSPSDWPSAWQPLVPLTTYQTVQFGFAPSGGWALLNPTLSPVTATFWRVAVGNFHSILATYTIPPGELYFPGTGEFLVSPGDALYLTASAPIRILACRVNYNAGQFEYPCQPPQAVGSVAFLNSFSSTWNWQVGTAPPQSGRMILPNIGGGASVSASVSPSTQQWLTVAPQSQDSMYFYYGLTPNLSGFSPGTYAETITFTFVPPPVLSALRIDPFVVQEILNISPAPFIIVAAPANFAAYVGGPAPAPETGPVSTDQQSTGSAKFQVTASTDSGGNWLSVTPASGSTPTTLTVSANPAGLAAGFYTGQLTVQGPANTVTVPATLNVTASPPVSAVPVTPASLSLFAEAGGSPAVTGSLYIGQGSKYAASVQTQSGGNWLAAAVVGFPYVTVSANTAGLAVGTYQGTVILASSISPTIQVPVTLAVLAPPAGLNVSPGSLFLTAAPGQAVTASLTVTPKGGQGLFNCAITYVGQGSSTYVSVTASPIYSPGPTVCQNVPTPATLQVQVSAPLPGTYYGSLAFTWTGGSLTVPFALSVSATSLLPPILAGIVNAASEMPGAISPGEIITLFGTGIGPGPAEFALDPSGKVPVNLATTQVLINGTPAPVLYASATQVNAIVPYEVGTTGTATVEVVFNGVESAAWGVPLAPSAPGIFAAGSIGVGQAAALNQDNSVNSASNPAARGSVVQFFATGEGATAPANVTGGVTPNGGNTTALPVKVTIGGIDTAVTYHGSAPGEVAGVLQVDAAVPADVVPGPAVPVVIAVGGRPSQGGITIAVR